MVTSASPLHSKGNVLMDNKTMEKDENITTQEQARQYAIDWQNWVAERGDISYGELAEWYGVFETLAHKFNLSEEFKENGII